MRASVAESQHGSGGGGGGGFAKHSPPGYPVSALVYKGTMLSEVPNLAWYVGYTNASWTLRADLALRHVCRLIVRLPHGVAR